MHARNANVIAGAPRGYRLAVRVHDPFPGIGNWMADEILWRARTSPRTLGGRPRTAMSPSASVATISPRSSTTSTS